MVAGEMTQKKVTSVIDAPIKFVFEIRSKSDKIYQTFFRVKNARDKCHPDTCPLLKTIKLWYS